MLAESQLSWEFVLLGAGLGITATLVLVIWLGRRFFKAIALDDRGQWDRPLAHPLPKDQVVSVYVRRRWYHRHHRDHYVRRHKQDGA